MQIVQIVQIAQNNTKPVLDHFSKVWGMGGWVDEWEGGLKDFWRIAYSNQKRVLTYMTYNEDPHFEDDRPPYNI